MRKIYIVGDISYNNYALFTERMTELESEGDEDIIVELTSDGGDSYVSLAYVGRIRKSKCIVRIVGNGYIASAAVLILAAGDRRAMTSESWLMVHEEAGEVNGNVALKEIEIKQLRRMEEQADNALSSWSKVSASQWKEFHKQTTYFTAHECFKMGLIDEVI